MVVCLSSGAGRALGPGRHGGEGRGARAQCRSPAARLVSLSPHLPTPCPRPGRPGPRGRRGQGVGRAGEAGGRGGPTVSNRFKWIEYRIDSNGFKQFATVQIRFKRFQADSNGFKPIETVSNRLKRFQLG